MKEIAELFREKREESGIDLKEVSKDLEIDELALQNIEDGKIGAFKDIFILKQHIADYAKYLGLNSDKIINEFNEYLFEYTSKIPIDKIEKEIQQNSKEEENKVVSPYTNPTKKAFKGVYIIVYIMILLLVVLAIIWSINQITVDKSNAYVVSYRK